jgi:hypothetical protein
VTGSPGGGCSSDSDAKLTGHDRELAKDFLQMLAKRNEARKKGRDQ